MVQSHDLGIARCRCSFTECCLFDGPSKEHTTENKWLQAVYFTASALLHVIHTTVKCHCLCMSQRNIEAWLALHYWWCWYLVRGLETASPRQCQVPFLGTWTIALQVVAFQPLISCVMTVWMVKNRGGRWRGYEYDLQAVPNFTEAHTAYKTVNSFFYMHSNSEHDEENCLNLELLLFHPKHMASTKHF
jgi:hypothetical protein